MHTHMHELTHLHGQVIYGDSMRLEHTIIQSDQDRFIVPNKDMNYVISQDQDKSFKKTLLFGSR